MPIVIYGIDGANNKYETMTKEQIIDAIEQAQQGQIPELDSAFITQIKEINHENNLRFWIGTQAEYNAIATPENNVLYIISDDTSKEEIIAAIENLAETLSGVPAAIENAKVKRTVLWTKSEQSRLQKQGDSATLSDNITNYDYIEIHLYEDAQEVKLFKPTNGEQIIINWSYLFSNSYDADDVINLATNRINLLLNNTTATVAKAMYLVSIYSTGQVTSAVDKDEVYTNNIYRIVGVKLP